MATARGKEIRANIVIGGKADKSSLKSVGSAIQELGSQINQVSQKLIDFGKESVENYVGFEDAMLSSKAAMRTQYESMSELERAYTQLTESALQWASQSRFTTIDVANGISEATHAGWNLQQVMAGVPAAMQAALAGGMDLSQSLEYLIDISNAAGLSFDELGMLTDYWTYAGNRASTNVEEMGEGLQKMGATLQFFKGDMAMAVSMMAMLADNGIKGTEAGTLLRNTMIRLIAPTKAAASAMDELGLSEEDLSEIFDDDVGDGLSQALQSLSEFGFSVYDQHGNLKDFLTIFTELAAAINGMDEEHANAVLSAIFPTRTITGAKALISGVDGEWQQLYNDVMGKSGGYAGEAGDIMESGLGGALRHLESVVDTLKTKVGSELSTDVTNVASGMSSFIDGINNMDPALFSGLVGGLEALAVAGPGLLTVGGAIAAIGAILSTGPIGGIILGGVAFSTLARGIIKYNEAAEKINYENQFGTLSADMDILTTAVANQTQPFLDTYTNIEKYNDAIDKAFENYSKDSSELAGGLITSVITGSTLTQEQIDGFMALGDRMRNSVIDGINGKYSKAEDAIILESGMTIDELYSTDNMWGSIMKTVNAGYDAAIAEAERLSNELRQAMVSAFADGKLDESERANIQAIMDDMNSVVSNELRAKNKVQEEKLLRKAQSMSADGIGEVLGLVNEYNKSAIDVIDDSYDNIMLAFLQGAYKDGMSDEEIQQNLNFINSEREAKKAEATKENNQLATSAIYATANTSDFSDAWNALVTMIAYQQEGQVIPDSIYTQYRKGQKNVEKFLRDSMVNVGYATWNSDEFALLRAMYGFSPDNIGSMANNDYDPGLNGDAYEIAEEALKKYGATPFYKGMGEVDNQNEFGVLINPDMTKINDAILGISETPVDITLVPHVEGATGGVDAYATGGRAEEASIFGEAGPEWAIPERHDANTLRLLNLAMRASGFSLSDMAGGGGGGNTLVYSPVIYANDATGVSSALMNDKQRMEKWLHDKQLRDELEVYA